MTPAAHGMLEWACLSYVWHCPSSGHVPFMHQLQSFVAFSVLFSSKQLQKITLTAVSFFHSAAHGMLEWECLSYDEDDENNYLRSYDVSALFTRLPIDKAMGVIRTKVEDDESLSKKIPQIPKWLKYTYFLYKGRNCLQVNGAAMGSPV